MSDYGFNIRKLVVVNGRANAAEVAFAPGLNVVAGASDTGKSYMLQCIEFMLGGKSPPKEIDEAKPYDSALLELEGRDTATIYSLRRSLQGGPFKLYESEIEGISSAGAPRILAPEHSATNEENISSFLLSLCRFPPAKVRKTKTKTGTQNFTFRTVAHLFIVDEESIIGERSPIWLATGYQRTASARAFNFIITGKDDSSLIAMPDIAHDHAKHSAKVELLELMLDDIEQQIANSDTPLKVLQQGIHDAESRIEEVSTVISASSDAIVEFQKTREQAWEGKQQADSRLIVIAELLKRFELLKEHYQSDFQRLRFISEGHFVFDHLATVTCPLCGTMLEEHVAHQMCIEFGDGSESDLQDACQREAEKIINHMADLDKTMSALTAERDEISAKAAQLGTTVENAEQQIAQRLKPVALASKAELDKLLAERKELLVREQLFVRLNEIQTAKQQMERQLTETPMVGKAPPTELDTNALQELCDEIGLVLEEWQYPDSGPIHFDQTSKWMDLVINGKRRQSHGKGVRALTHSAFNIGLMRFCRKRGLSHPLCVVLDSPLVSLRERKKANGDGEVSEEVQQAFFSALATMSSDEQLIIFENKEPTLDVQDAINYIEFTGTKGVGRQGFFPPID